VKKYRLLLQRPSTRDVTEERTVLVEALSLNAAIDKAEWELNETTIHRTWIAHCAEEIL